MSQFQTQLKAALEKVLSPQYLEIINESIKHQHHAGHSGGGDTHFRLIIVSEKFKSMSRVERQRMVNHVAFQLGNDKLHALAMKTFSPEEWVALDTSKCE